MEALGRISKVFLFIALLAVAGLSIRSAIIASEKLRAAEQKIFNLKLACQELDK